MNTKYLLSCIIILFLILNLPNLTGASDKDYNVIIDQFTRITEGPHVTNSTRSGGVCWVDYNNDNYLDIYETNARYPDMENNCLYENNGDGTFTQRTDLSIVNDDNFSTCAIWADYDNDNDLDLFVAAHRTHPNLFYINNGDGSFTLNTSTPVDDNIVGSTSASWIDYNNDGDVDLFVGNSTCGSCPDYPPYRNFLFKNTGGVFTEILTGDIVTIEKHTYGTTWCDYDNDGDVDLIDPNYNDEITDLYRNEGDDIFTHITTDVITAVTGNGGHSAWADYDNDSDMDLFLGGNTPGTNLLYNNNGDGTFSEAVNNGLGLLLNRSDNGSWVDFDNDGDQDILIWCIIYEFGVDNSDSAFG
ncbi:FG-GAP repeat domain-containing protein [Candidatus Zixiibacteriota bacterium]